MPQTLTPRHLSSRKGDQLSPNMGFGKIPPALKNSDFVTAEQALRGMRTADSSSERQPSWRPRTLDRRTSPSDRLLPPVPSPQRATSYPSTQQ